MAMQYFCQNKRRRQAVDAHAVLNGIDYLEVLDSESPIEALRQRTLMVRCLKVAPDNLTPQNVLVEGGVRVESVKVEWISRADLAGPLLQPAEQAYFAGLPELDHLLLIRTESTGDYSVYSLRLVTSLTNADPLPNFDPILSEVEFSFKVECPVDFDCEVDDDCPPEPEDAPVIDYLAKDYNSLRQLILDRMAITMPEWQERHVPDLNIALVELLAYAGDYLSAFQDGVATEAYLDTARRRPSLRRHARLLNYPMHDGCNARTWVVFDVAVEQVELKAKPPIQLLTKIPEPTIIDSGDLGELVSRYQPAVFELAEDVTLRGSRNTIEIYTWGDDECCLPAGATQATLVDGDTAAQKLELKPGDVIIFEEVRDPATDQTSDADITQRHAVRLTKVKVGQDTLFDQPIVDVQWHGADALPFPLCVSVKGADEAISVVRGNVALADHGWTISGELLPPRKQPYGNSKEIRFPDDQEEAQLQARAHRRYRPYLQERNVTQRVQLSEGQPATSSLAQNPRETLPEVEIVDQQDGTAWKPQRDLLRSGRFATEFVVEIENDGRASLRFGDDQHFGQVPEYHRQLAVTYRVGNGENGNVGADTLAHIVTSIGGINGVRNPLPAAGGANPERLDEVRLYAPQAFRRQERAVTEADYEEMAERHPEVQRAVATRRWTGSWHTMFVSVDREGGLTVDDTFEARLRLHLERYRLTGHDVEIDGPRFAPLDIRFTVCVKPGYFRSDVKEALLKVFSNGILADGTLGYFHPDNFSFGQRVYLSDIVAVAMGVTGVQWVDFQPKQGKDHRFRRWRKKAAGEIDDGYIKIGRLEIAQLDNDPSRPENGRMEFYMEGGS